METEQKTLTMAQKEAMGLLSIGTFLEYFDLMLFIHMAILLNDLFFPKTDPHTATVISAFAFCSTYLLRPFGALIFGWIGDNIGRKATVIITTSLMSTSCVIMANLPTYEQVGITAAWLVTICRIVQGMSSMGEIIGAELYLTELIKPPIQYPIVGLMVCSNNLGTICALGVATLVTSYGLNWRLAFWIGAGIALIGMVARTTLRETPDFADAKRKLKKNLEDLSTVPTKIISENIITNEKVNKKTSLALFCSHCAYPTGFYFVYMHCADILKNKFHCTAEEIIHQNLIVGLVQLLSVSLMAYLSYRIYPLIILKVKLVIFSCLILFFPYLLSNAQTPKDIFLIQSLVWLFLPWTHPAGAIFYKHFPVFKRFTYTSFMYALSRALVYALTSFGLISLTYYFGNYAILIMMLFILAGFTFGILHFEKLEKEVGNYRPSLDPLKS